MATLLQNHPCIPITTLSPAPQLRPRDAKNIFRFTTLTAPNFVSTPTSTPVLTTVLATSPPRHSVQPAGPPSNGSGTGKGPIYTIPVAICLAVFVGLVVGLIILWKKGKLEGVLRRGNESGEAREWAGEEEEGGAARGAGIERWWYGEEKKGGVQVSVRETTAD